jgi:hypothetical protein
LHSLPLHLPWANAPKSQERHSELIILVMHGSYCSTGSSL